MNLADMLCYADIHQLRNIAEKYDCDCNSHSKNELIQSILTRVYRREAFKKQLTELQLEDLRFLNSMLFDQKEAFSLEDLLARVKQTKFQQEDREWSPRERIVEYKTRGWLFNGITRESKYLFQFPDDLKKRFAETMQDHFQGQLIKSEEPEVYKDERQLILDDILAFLKLVRQEEVPLTATGFIYKRQLQQWLSSLAVHEELPAKAAWRFGYGRKYKEYPDRFSLIYDYCYFHQYIEEIGERLVLTSKGQEKADNLERENPMNVYRFWLRLYKNPIYNIQSLIRWIERLGKRWVTIDSVKSILLPYVKSFYYDKEEVIIEQRIIHMMLHLGLISLGEKQGIGTVMKVNELGSKVISGTYVKEEDFIKIDID